MTKAAASTNAQVRGGVVLAHGLNTTPAVMDELAAVLNRAGYACAHPDERTLLTVSPLGSWAASTTTTKPRWPSPDQGPLTACLEPLPVTNLLAEYT